MHIGGVLVLLGVIFAVLSLFTTAPVRGAGNRAAYGPPLLAVAVVLIGIGVLIGNTVLR